MGKNSLVTREHLDQGLIVHLRSSILCPPSCHLRVLKVNEKKLKWIQIAEESVARFAEFRVSYCFFGFWKE